MEPFRCITLTFFTVHILLVVYCDKGFPPSRTDGGAAATDLVPISTEALFMGPDKGLRTHASFVGEVYL